MINIYFPDKAFKALIVRAYHKNNRWQKIPIIMCLK